MQRVAFIVDATGERVDCLLNPETVEVTRQAGVRPPASSAGHLVGAGQADDPLLFTGGGRTDLVVDLMFDVDLVEPADADPDVRRLTGRLWRLAENSARERGAVRPPVVRFVWGKSWNMPGVIVAIAERFDLFDATGAPRRSWLRLKLRRVAEPDAPPAGGYDTELAAAAQAAPVPAAADAVAAVGDGEPAPGYSGVRFDLLAGDALGNPHRWRMLAAHNDIDNPMDVPPGAVLSVPPLGGAA